jgi:hypothetical protein
MIKHARNQVRGGGNLMQYFLLFVLRSNSCFLAWWMYPLLVFLCAHLISCGGDILHFPTAFMLGYQYTLSFPFRRSSTPSEITNIHGLIFQQHKYV